MFHNPDFFRLYSLEENQTKGLWKRGGRSQLETTPTNYRHMCLLALIFTKLYPADMA